MVPGATLFVAVCTQRDFWPGGAWPIVDDATAAHVAALVALATRFGVREGGVICRHPPTAPRPAGRAATVHTGGPGLPGDAADATGGALPAHCIAGSVGAEVAPGCAPSRPLVVAAAGPAPALDRSHAYWVANGCARSVDDDPAQRRVFDHLTAGVRDAVVFGAGVEYAMAYAVDALLARRVRTHVVLDAAAAVDGAAAQTVVAGWKRRGVDGATAATVARLLERPAAP
jgi:nicotinamidase-related amidase